MLARLIAQCTTRGTTYQPGNISTKEQADAALAARELEARANQAATDMLKLDDSEHDLNPAIPHNVYLARTNPSGYTGHAVKSEGGTVSRLQADSGDHQYTVSTNGSKKEIRHLHINNGQSGEKALFTEEWVISDGSSAKYKRIEYWEWPNKGPELTGGPAVNTEAPAPK